MTEFAISPPPQASVAIANSDQRFPVRRIFCVGRNYAAHAREMGNDPDRDPPFFFTKPADTVVDSGTSLIYPPQTEDLHFEVELVVALGKGGFNIAEEDVHDHIWGAGVGIDLTRRDLQAAAKQMGRPWDMAKGFDQSAPIAPLTPLADVTSLDNGRIWLAIDGNIKQDADISDMIWSVKEHISILSRSVALAPGDLVMTGTPAGVGSLRPGNVVTGSVAGLSDVEITIMPRLSDARG